MIEISKITNILTGLYEPNEKLNQLLKLIDEINAGYSDTMFCITDSFSVSFDIELQTVYPSKTASVIRTPDSAAEKKDEAIRKWEDDCAYYIICKNYLKTFNERLSMQERACIVYEYFNKHNRFSKKEIYDKCNLTWRSYCHTLQKAKEKLIEEWCLDAFGGASDNGNLLSWSYIEYSRSERQKSS